MIAIRGFASAIAQSLIDLLPDGEEAVPVERGGTNTAAGRHLFCSGLLVPKTIIQRSAAELGESFMANAGRVIAQCDLIIATNDEARICVIGSESGYSWSFDGAYAAAKAGLHRYVETKRLRTSRQQLVCVAPGIIGDAGMTLRRTDTPNLEQRRLAHPKQRWLTSLEVARLVHHVLYVDEGYLSGIAIRMNGGAHT